MRVRPGCNHQGCARPHQSHGYCSAHAAQYRSKGRTWEIGVKQGPAFLDRVLAQTSAEGECLLWTGYVMPNGYGQVSWKNKKWLTHRAVWTVARGAIPDDLTVDHLCRRRSCINVDHMEIVTRGENSLRGGGLQKAYATYAARTHCKWGHEYDPEKGHKCFPCQRVSWWRWAIRTGYRDASALPVEHVALYTAKYGTLDLLDVAS